MRATRVGAVLIVTLAFVASACGTDDELGARGSATAPTHAAATEDASSSNGGSAAGDSPSEAAPRVTSTSQPLQAGETAPALNGDAESPPLPLKVRFDHPCVRPGEMQKITIEIGTKGSAAFNTVYADGKNVYDPDYPGGNEGDVTDASGRYQHVWTIGPAAAPGTADVSAIGFGHDGKSFEGNSSFEVAGLDGACG